MQIPWFVEDVTGGPMEDMEFGMKALTRLHLRQPYIRIPQGPTCESLVFLMQKAQEEKASIKLGLILPISSHVLLASGRLLHSCISLLPLSHAIPFPYMLSHTDGSKACFPYHACYVLFRF